MLKYIILALASIGIVFFALFKFEKACEKEIYIYFDSSINFKLSWNCFIIVLLELLTLFTPILFNRLKSDTFNLSSLLL